ncbi:MAG TPA: alpha/beta hydrolase [Sphingomicrobium sp.]|nr:alpha/beta hydrolase [Sphingomicrobium sp.]
MNDAAATERFEDRHFTVRDGLRLHYRDYPGSRDRPPLLCLHGLTRNARDFAELAERYSPRFRVIALEFRGRGQSDYDPLPARYMPLTYANDVIELLDQLEIPRAIFIGTSLGALVTMLLAVMSPQPIAAAILNDIGPDVSPAGIERIKSYVGKDVRFASWDEAANTIAGNYGSAFDRYTHEDWLKMAQRNCREENGEIRFDYDMAIAIPFNTGGETPQVDMWPLFRALAEKPLLVVRGERSDLLTAETADKMQAVAPDMKLAVVAGVGHAPELNEPEAVEAIDAFLGELERTAAA